MFSEFTNDSDREITFSYLTGISYLIDLKDKKTAENYLEILKKYLKGSRLPS